MKKLSTLFLTLLITLLLAINFFYFSSLDSVIEKESVIVSRVIDGDTLVLKDGRTLRLLNINSPEKNSPLSKSSTDFLRYFENKSIEIEITGQDK